MREGETSPEEGALAPGSAGSVAEADASRSSPVRLWFRATGALVGRELAAYFKSTMAYIIMFFFYLVTGLVFLNVFEILSRPGTPPTEFPMLNWFMFTLFFALTVIVPAITMRLFSDELKTRTLEPLCTAPVTDFQIVISKYLAALGFYVVLLAPTFLYAVILYSTAKPHPPDRGPMVAGYLGLFFLGSYFLSIGIFASACTKNQIVAFIGTFMAILVLQLVYVFRRLISLPWWKEFLEPFDFFENFMDFGRGVVDTRHIVYYLAMSALFLFLTVGVLGVRKWRL